MLQTRPRLPALLALAAVVAHPAPASGRKAADALVERAEAGRQSRVVVTLEAEGRYLPGESTDEQPVEPLELTVRTRLDYLDQVLEVDDDSRPRRSARRMDEAEVVIGGGEPIRAQEIRLRPEVSSLVADRLDGGEVLVASPRGPLTRTELELVQVPADPLELADLLPDPGTEAAPGDGWPVPESAARWISGYDALSSNTARVTLRSLDGDSAEFDLDGRVEGAVLGARGRMDVEGSFRFDREAGRVASITLRRAERREAGPVEAGLEFRSTLTVDRSDAPEGSEPIPAPGSPGPLPGDWLLLSYTPPDGRYRLEHDRSWYVFAEDDRQSVLRCFEGGTVVAQADLVAGPTVGPGARPKADRFRDDVREALGDRFDRVLDAGQVASPPGESRYRLAIAGRQGDEPIVWYYYLVSDASGRQLVAIFTLRASGVERLGRRDQRLIDSLRWLPPPAADPR
ncbi:hypothetical protein [Tautonia plasticadhaerens]|uniref:Uncharacterized protein n=1 Tax=Tautonia plasticadhaerens TaxID=2527974 RepID=A0A518GUK5_9BACT|nr:hypothetical protein [Tautonia plasticadhaerens]QDV32270.1 hypothetical protein ElP_00930 [Tautonia plasticadhaerens]